MPPKGSIWIREAPNGHARFLHHFLQGGGALQQMLRVTDAVFEDPAESATSSFALQKSLPISCVSSLA